MLGIKGHRKSLKIERFHAKSIVCHAYMLSISTVYTSKYKPVLPSLKIILTAQRQIPLLSARVCLFYVIMVTIFKSPAKMVLY